MKEMKTLNINNEDYEMVDELSRNSIEKLNKNNIIYIDSYEEYCEKVNVDDIEYIDWLPAFKKALETEKCLFLHSNKTYYISDSINIDKQGVSIIGENKWTSVIKVIPNSEITDNGIIVINNQHIILDSFKLIGNDELLTDEKTGVYTVGNNKSNDSIISNLVICHIKGDGITTEEYSYDLHFENIVIYGVDNGINHNSSDCYFSNLIVRGCKYNGIILNKGSNSLNQCKVYRVGKINEGVEESNITDTGYGFLLKFHTNTLINCQAQECGADGYKLDNVNGCIIEGCISDSNGRYINTSIGFNLVNCVNCRVSGIAVNKYYLNNDIDNSNMPTGLKVIGSFNDININTYNIGNSTSKKYFNEDIIYENDISNSIIINGTQLIRCDYENYLDRGSDNKPTDFSKSQVGSPNPVYGFDVSNHCCSIEIVNANSGANAKLVKTIEVDSTIFTKISSYVERKDLIKDKTLSQIRLIFLDSTDNEISRVLHAYSEFYKDQYTSRLGWTPVYANDEIPENTSKIKFELVSGSTGTSINNTTYFRNFKYLLS